MNNVLVAYISRCSFRSLPVVRRILGEDFKLSALAYERVFADEATAASVRAELLPTEMRWWPGDEVFLEHETPAAMTSVEAFRLAREHEAWRGFREDATDDPP